MRSLSYKRFMHEDAAPYISLSKMYVGGRLVVNGPNKLLLKM